ncbi:MAG: cysteine desulfurase [Ruminococcaceae bacterium]|nr:cysteine desulfurase [Oscillospiraceae bacterium]
MIYLDNSATTRPFDAVIALMAEMQQNNFGNPSSLHRAGILAERAMIQARNQVLSCLGGQDGNFVFTAGGTEANNLAILGTMLSRIRRTPRIITSEIEHPSVMEVVLYLKSLGADCQFVRVDQNGQVDKEHFAELLTENTALVSVMSVNNETGATQDIATLCRMAKQKNPDVLFHTDAVQALGKIPLNVKETGVDLLSVSSHKINGPKGAGGLYIRRGVHVKPVLFGGGQENGLRSGTQNTPAICGFGLASELTMASMAEKTAEMARLRTKLSEGLSKIPGCQVVSVENPAPHIVCATFPGLKSETLLHTLEMREIYVSSGSACSSNKPQLSPTLLAMGKSRKEIEGAIRFSLGHNTTEADIEAALSAAREESELLLGISR